jgi:hypothetical protein
LPLLGVTQLWWPKLYVLLLIFSPSLLANANKGIWNNSKLPFFPNPYLLPIKSHISISFALWNLLSLTHQQVLQPILWRH